MLKRILFLLWVLFFNTGATAKGEYIAQSLMDETFAKIASDEGVPEKLLRAICWAESRHVPPAYNHGDGVGTNHAFGMCQVLHSTARGFGFKDANCFRDFRASKTRNYDDCKLFGIYTNITYGAKYLRTKLDQYGGDWEKAAAAYNAGSVRICKTGHITRAKDKTILWTCKVGDIANRKYINDVMQAVREHR